ncbi:MAG: mobile mystery protein B [Rhodobacteraceae bacterium]|nr:mobile mystery protein B [Paracoccaceae bacterium]
MNNLFEEPADATPPELKECEGLLQTWVTYRQDLNEAEQKNIAAGTVWAKRACRRDLLTEEFLLQLHKRLFGEVWAWAGKFRRTERNIGIEPVQVSVELRKAFDDARYWIEHNIFPPDEIAVRLHHRLVAIHPFPNGNGRTSRLLGDLLVVRLGREVFSWGRPNLTDTSKTRTRYINALQAADNHDIKPLLEFARS